MNPERKIQGSRWCLLLLAALLGTSSHGAGGTYLGDGSDQSFAPQPVTLTIAPQYRKEFVTQFALDDLSGDELFDPLMGKSDLSPQTLLAKLAPALADCAATPKGEKNLGKTSTAPTLTAARIRYFDIQCSGYKIAGAEMIVQESRERLRGVSLGGVADLAAPPAFTASDFLPLTDVASQFIDGMLRSERLLVPEGGNLTPAWQIVWENQASGIRTVTVIDALSGATIHQRNAGMNLNMNLNMNVNLAARVFARSPLDIDLSDVVLKGVSGPHLDGPLFSVSSGPDAARVSAGSSGFVFDPWQSGPQENRGGGAAGSGTPDFDQVQTYYGASRAAEWFQSRFGYDPGSTTIPVQINRLIDNSPNNAAYFGPAEGGPEIQIGAGDGNTLTNLGRDIDVVTHEFAHHVIYRRLQRTSGESGVIHEGTADYFTYALNNDPYLGRSIKPGAVSLRTAVAGPDDRIDNPNYPSQRHLSGQIWSAMLWDLRSQIGAQAADDIVFHAIDYWGAGAGFSDALLGLLQADRDLHPRPVSDPEFGIFGEFKCQIFRHGIARGFAQLMEQLDATSCNLDMRQAAAESRAYSERIAGSKKKKGYKVGVSLAGVKCGSVGESHLEHSERKDPMSLAWLLGMLLLPLVPAGLSLCGRKHSTAQTGG